MKHLLTTLAIALAAAFSASAKTFDWPIGSPDAGARQFAAYHGETVRFNLQFRGAMTNLSPVAIYYQTNGMGRAEWFGPVPGTVFHPTNDCGAASYRFFVRCTDPDGINYTANGSLRMLDSPGFEPSALPLPVQTLDFSKIEVLNPPWGSGGGGVDAATATNIAEAVSASAASALDASLSSRLSRSSLASTNYTDAATNALDSSLSSRLSRSSLASTNYTDAAVAAKRDKTDLSIDPDFWLVVKPDGTKVKLDWDATDGCWECEEGSLWFGSGYWALYMGETVLDGLEAPADSARLVFEDGTDVYRLYRATELATNADLAEGIAAVAAVPGTVSNIVTKAYVEGLGIKGGGSELDDPVRHCTWVQCVTNGVFYWTVKEEE